MAGRHSRGVQSAAFTPSDREGALYLGGFRQRPEHVANIKVVIRSLKVLPMARPPTIRAEGDFLFFEYVGRSSPGVHLGGS